MTGCIRFQFWPDCWAVAQPLMLPFSCCTPRLHACECPEGLHQLNSVHGLLVHLAGRKKWGLFRSPASSAVGPPWKRTQEEGLAESRIWANTVLNAITVQAADSDTGRAEAKFLLSGMSKHIGHMHEAGRELNLCKSNERSSLDTVLLHLRP